MNILFLLKMVSLKHAHTHTYLVRYVLLLHRTSGGGFNQIWVINEITSIVQHETPATVDGHQ